MKGAGKVPFLDFDPDEDSRSLATFSDNSSEGAKILEEVLKNKLNGLGGQSREGRNAVEVS
jgi:hypothetical protein